MSSIKIRVRLPGISAPSQNPTILTKALDVLNRPPSPTPEQIQTQRVHKQVSLELQHLLQRARDRYYADTVPVLSFYWLSTLRQRYDNEFFIELEAEIRNTLANPELSTREMEALQSCQKWVKTARSADARKRRTPLPAAPFTSERYAPPESATQTFLENLLNGWLPQTIAEKYAQRLIDEGWGLDNAYAEAAFCLEEILSRRAVFPELDVVRRLDRLQRRAMTSEADLLLWRRRQQASLEALILTPGKDASSFDPKTREILADVVLFLLGISSPAPLPHAGRAWLLPAYIGADSPPELAEQVSQFALPEDYVNRECLTIPVSNWHMPLHSRENLHSFSIYSSILTPDGRVWDARSVSQESAKAGVVYGAVGRVDAKPTSQGSVLAVPTSSFPGEVSQRFAELTELKIYNRRWHMDRIEGQNGEVVAYYRVVDPAVQTSAERERRTPAVKTDERRMLRAS